MIRNAAGGSCCSATGCSGSSNCRDDEGADAAGRRAVCVGHAGAEFHRLAAGEGAEGVAAAAGVGGDSVGEVRIHADDHPLDGVGGGGVVETVVIGNQQLQPARAALEDGANAEGAEGAVEIAGLGSDLGEGGGQCRIQARLGLEAGVAPFVPAVYRGGGDAQEGRMVNPPKTPDDEVEPRVVTMGSIRAFVSRLRSVLYVVLS
jgi:hypothetical protein